MYFGTTQSSWNTAITSYLMRPKRKSIIPHHSIIIRFFLFILFVEREYLSGLIDITVGLCVPLVLRKELRSCSSSSTRQVGSLAHFWLELLSSSLTIVTGRHFNPNKRYYLGQTHTKFLISLLKMVIIKVGTFFVSCSFFVEGGPPLLKTNRIYHFKKNLLEPKFWVQIICQSVTLIGKSQLWLKQAEDECHKNGQEKRSEKQTLKAATYQPTKLPHSYYLSTIQW